jgi:hypothetical protein
MVTHFQLPPYEFLCPTRQAKDIAINANSRSTYLIFSKKQLHGSTQHNSQYFCPKYVQEFGLITYNVLRFYGITFTPKYSRVKVNCKPRHVQYFLLLRLYIATHFQANA